MESKLWVLKTYVGINLFRYAALRITVGLILFLTARLRHYTERAVLEHSGFRFPALVGFGGRDGHSATFEGSLQHMPGVLDFGVLIVAFDGRVHFGRHSFVHLRSEDVGQHNAGNDQTEDDEDDREVDD